MKPFNELEEAEIRMQFRRMYQDLGMIESLLVLNELITTAHILDEVLQDELNESKKKGNKGLDPA